MRPMLGIILSTYVLQDEKEPLQTIPHSSGDCDIVPPLIFTGAALPVTPEPRKLPDLNYLWIHSIMTTILQDGHRDLSQVKLLTCRNFQYC